MRYDYKYLEDDYGMEIQTPLLWQDSILFTVTCSYRQNMGIDLVEPVLWKDNLRKTDSISIVVDSFYSQFLTSNHANTYPSYAVTDSSIILVCESNDSISRYTHEGKLINTIPVKSQYVTAKIPAVPAERINELDNEFLRNSWVEDIIYDPYRQLYYCVIDGPWNNWKERASDFSIIVYNSGFLPIGEQRFSGKDFSSTCFVSAEGLYVRKRTNERNTKFTLFKINKR